MSRDDALGQRMAQAQAWLAALDAMDVQFLVADSERDADLVQAAQSDQRWIADLEEDGSVLFRRAQATDSLPAAA